MYCLGCYLFVHNSQLFKSHKCRHFNSWNFIYILAQGYARSDGVVILYIQKYCNAKRSYGSVVHVNTQYDGVSDNELLKINTSNMTTFLEDFFRSSPVKPEEIGYVETYGCGIKVCDTLLVNRAVDWTFLIDKFQICFVLLSFIKNLLLTQ